MANHIAQLDNIYVSSEQKGLVLEYDPKTGRWKNERTETVVSEDELKAYKGKPIVLLADWIGDINQKKLNNSGFAEAAADALFAAMVKLDQDLDGGIGGANNSIYDSSGKLIRTQGTLFKSSLHFIGFGQGAVVNSEIVQRLGTYYPNAGGEVKYTEDGKIDDSQRKLNFTVVDPVTYGGSTNPSFKYILDPAIIVWKNVTYADIFYQDKDGNPFPDPTASQITQDKFPQNSQELKQQYDWQKNLSSLAGFDGSAAHERALDWYTGTANLTEGTEGRYRRLGDLLVNPNSGQNWYSQDQKLANFEHGDQNAVWEGIGTGWFSSVLGGDYEYRPYSIDNALRSSVSLDNTPDARMRGDYAIPTLFDGNFDAIAAPSDQEIPSWNFQDSRGIDSQNNLVYGIAGNQSYALRLDTQLASITHNPFVVPDWGVLRFDVHVPVPSSLDDMNDYIQVYLETDTQTYNLKSQQIHPDTIIPGDQINQKLPAVDLREVHPEAFSDPDLGVAIPYERIQSQLNRIGFGSKGFETFQVDVPDEVRGKTARLKISLRGDTPVYIDNVFFKSKHLQFGNPVLNGQEARQDEGFSQINNYLIEKPQFALSYNESLKTPNWVSYQLNSLWNEGPNGNVPRKEVGDPYVADYSLPSPPLTRVPGAVTLFPDDGVKYDIFQRGHMTRAEDRSRLVESYYPDSQTNEHYKIYKDYKLTYLMTNMVPQNIIEKGVDPWGQLEIFLSDTLVEEKGKELYIIAGRDGERKTFIAPIDGVNASISAPSHVWKVFLVLNPGEGIADVTKDTLAFAVDIPNFSQGDVERGTPGAPPTLSKDWKKYVVSINDLEAVIGYNFFNNIPTDIQETIESNTDISKLLNLPKASLKAELEVETSSVFEILKAGTFINTSIRQPQVPNEGIMDSEDGLRVNSSPQASTDQNSFFQIGVEQVGIPQSSFSQISPEQVGFTQVNITPITSTQNSITQIGFAQINFNQVTPNHTSSEQIGFTQITSLNANATQVSTSQINPSQINIFKNPGRNQIDSSEVTLSSSITLQQLFSSYVHLYTSTSKNTYKDNPLHLWSTLFDPSNSFNINFQITDLPTGQLAEAQITQFDSFDRPNGGTILIDDDANGVGWFIDPTPWENSEFAQTLTDTAFRATTGDAFGKYDLLTTILHETGHLLGIINGNPEFDSNLQTLNGKKVFVGKDFTANLSPDGSHLDAAVHPYDLMNNTLAPSVRKLPSLLNLEIINAIRGINTSDVPQRPTNPSPQPFFLPVTSTNWKSTSYQPTTPSTSTSLAPLRAILLADITNGNFEETDTTKPEFGWSTRGAANILNSQAVLTEDSPFNSNFTQTFIIPSHAKYLQFTILDTHLGTNEFAPNDAFEVALLDARTLTPLVGTSIGLTQTDSLLNLQQTGNAYFSDKVKIAGANTSGDKIALNTPRTVKIDISNIAPGTLATLYFDLLGFGAKDGKVIIDNVMLLDKDLISPTAIADTATTDQGKPVLINILANDSDADGTINPSTVQIGTAPHTGTIIINSDGTLTYTWNFGDDSNPVTGQTLNHTFADNGTYTAILTVTDKQPMVYSPLLLVRQLKQFQCKLSAIAPLNQTKLS